VIARGIFLACVLILLIGWCTQVVANEPRVWVLAVCEPKGVRCVAYAFDMIPHHYITKTACDVDATMSPRIPDGHYVRCVKESELPK
jgi:hypothetical protein